MWEISCKFLNPFDRLEQLVGPPVSRDSELGRRLLSALLTHSWCPQSTSAGLCHTIVPPGLLSLKLLLWLGRTHHISVHTQRQNTTQEQMWKDHAFSSSTNQAQSFDEALTKQVTPNWHPTNHTRLLVQPSLWPFLTELHRIPEC